MIAARSNPLKGPTATRFRRHRGALLALLVAGFIVLVAVAGPLVVTDPLTVDLTAVRQAPSARHLLGTDLAGRDIMSRVVYGARTSLLVGLGAVTILVLTGTIVGLLAGFFGGILDPILMRTADAVLIMPILLLVSVFVAAVGQSTFAVIVLIGFLGWPATARLVRGVTIALRDSEFIDAARVVGMRDRDIVIREVLPSVTGPLIVVATLALGNAILLEAGLSFLGLGVRPPEPSLGLMINAARSATVLTVQPWIWLPPAAAIVAIVLTVNTIGDGLRDALDPRLVGSDRP